MVNNMKQVDYKKCAQCGKMFFPTRKNRKYCSHECYLKTHRKPVNPRICPICKKTFTPKRANQKYCCVNCSSKAYYQRKKQNPQIREKKPKPQPEKNPEHFKIRNPIAVIGNIEVRFTRTLRHNEPLYFKGASEKNPNYKVIHDESLWFIQNEKNRNLDLETVKKRNFKVSDVLLHNGYEVEDPDKFDKAFKKAIGELL